MRKLMLCMVLLLLFGCNSEKENVQENEVIEEEKAVQKQVSPEEENIVLNGVYNLNMNDTEVKWVGGKAIPGGDHFGTIAAKNGMLKFENKNFIEGSILLDPTQLTVTDLEADSANGLIGHLQAEDYFDIKKYPEIVAKITKMEQQKDNKIMAEIELTIKEKTQKIPFTGVIIKTETGFNFTAKLEFDRTKFDIGVGLKAKILRNAIELDVNANFSQ